MTPTIDRFKLYLNRVDGKISCKGLYSFSQEDVQGDLNDLVAALNDINANAVVRHVFHPPATN